MDENLYDEFGNYIGPELEEEEEEENGWAERMQTTEEPEMLEKPKGSELILHGSETAIILHEDKKYYPSAEETYPNTEIRVEDEDTMPLTEPIIAPIKIKKFEILEQNLPPTTYSKEFLVDLMAYPELIRCVAIAGHLHHGKTTFMDMLIQQTHPQTFSLDKELRYTDVRTDERDRGLSLKAKPMSVVMQNSAEKSFLLQVYDTPGHVNFLDEVTAAMRVADGAVVLVDAVEGVMLNTENILRLAVREGLPIVLVVNKMDRLILELKLPPTDAYYKLRHTIEEVNTIINAAGSSQRVSPELGNVCFASPQFGWSFTLSSFARLYYKSFGGGVDSEEFALRLWGDLFFHPQDRKFRPQPWDSENSKRSFVQFVLEPLYKLYAQVVGEEPETLKGTLEELGIYLKREQFHMDARPLLKLVLSQFFGKANGFVDLITKHIPSPVQSAKDKVRRVYSGPISETPDYVSSDYVTAMMKCDAKSEGLMIYITKLYPKSDASSFDAFGRIMCGTVTKGMPVQILGEGYTLEDEEDKNLGEITKIWIFESRYRIEVEKAGAGNWVLLEGIDTSILKTATITDLNNSAPFIFRPLSFPTISVVKVAVEPLNPSELPKMLDALRKINKSYPLAVTKVEESGEHIILGTGKLNLD